MTTSFSNTHPLKIKPLLVEMIAPFKTTNPARPDLPIFQRLSILLITLLKFDLFVSMMRDNTDSGSGYRVCMVMTERLVNIFRFQV